MRRAAWLLALGVSFRGVDAEPNTATEEPREPCPDASDLQCLTPPYTCLPAKYRCDTIEQCPRGEDEWQCPSVTPRAGTTRPVPSAPSNICDGECELGSSPDCRAFFGGKVLCGPYEPDGQCAPGAVHCDPATPSPAICPEVRAPPLPSPLPKSR